MNRCQTPDRARPGPASPRVQRLARLATAAIAALALLPALAQSPTDQTVRRFPDEARRGVLRVVAAPEIVLDGKADRLSPGARIRNADNLLVLPQQLAGQELRVNYTRESLGLVHQVWILTPAELAQRRAGFAPQAVQGNIRFASETAPN